MAFDAIKNTAEKQIKLSAAQQRMQLMQPTILIKPRSTNFYCWFDFPQDEFTNNAQPQGNYNEDGGICS